MAAWLRFGPVLWSLQAEVTILLNRILIFFPKNSSQKLTSNLKIYIRRDRAEKPDCGQDLKSNPYLRALSHPFKISFDIKVFFVTLCLLKWKYVRIRELFFFGCGSGEKTMWLERLHSFLCHMIITTQIKPSIMEW